MTAGPRRVLVLGNAGSGKSTLARRIGAGLGLDVVHLDALYWRPGWVEPTRAEWADTVAGAISGDAWVMDGNYSGTVDARLARADAVVLLDLPRPLCLWRVLVRRVRYHGSSRPDMAGGCPERITWGFLVWIWRYPRRSRAAMLDRLAAVADGRPIYILRRPGQVRAFTRALDRHHRLPAPVRSPSRPASHARRRTAAIAIGLLVLASIILDHWLGRPSDAWARYDHRTFAVQSVRTDGVLLDDGTAVRLLGVADPSPAAADWLAGHAVGRRVTLLLPTVGVRDTDGRLVGYVYVADDCLNVALVKDGLAYADRRQADPLAGLIDVAETDARRKRRGMWDGLRFDQMPPWRQAWVRLRAAAAPKP